jgi:energy-coupling factor transporter ATP-binding protein EcfA2
VTEAAGLIEAHKLTKRFGDTVAVDHLSFTVEPGRVTGFLGPNGAGKSTTMRLILGLDRPQSGMATIGGLAYHQLARPLHTVGALLESRSVHPGRSARNHLLFLAETQGFPARRVDEVLDLVGLRAVAGKRAGGFPPLVGLIPGTIANHIHGYLPTVAGQLVAQTIQEPGDVLSAWQGFGVFCLWTAVLLALCGWLLVRRDA